MDTAPYSNILKAVGENPTIDYGSPPESVTAKSGSVSFQIPSEKPKLTLEQQAMNYDTFSELMKQGVYLPDLVQSIEALKAEVAELKKGAKTGIDTDLFEAMEASVKGVPEVKQARQRMADVKSTVINELCMNDPRYKEAYDDYRRAVNKAYIDRAERNSDAEGDAEIRQDARRRSHHQKAVP